MDRYKEYKKIALEYLHKLTESIESDDVVVSKVESIADFREVEPSPSGVRQYEPGSARTLSVTTVEIKE